MLIFGLVFDETIGFIRQYLATCLCFMPTMTKLIYSHSLCKINKISQMYGGLKLDDGLTTIIGVHGLISFSNH